MLRSYVGLGHEDRSSHTHHERCMSMQELGSGSQGMGSPSQLHGLHLDPMASRLPQSADRQQMVDFLDAPNLMQSDPPNPTQQLGLARHSLSGDSGVDLSSLRLASFTGTHFRPDQTRHPYESRNFTGPAMLLLKDK